MRSPGKCLFSSVNQAYRATTKSNVTYRTYPVLNHLLGLDRTHQDLCERGKLAEKLSRILYIDNDVSSCDLFRQKLADCDYVLTCITDAEDAVPLVLNSQFDLYIVEDVPTKLAGIEVWRRITAIDGRTPLIIYGSSFREADREAAFDAGVRKYLSKPDEFDRLINIINEMLNPRPIRFRRLRSAGRGASII
jgi:CheY-like chemotaxis protein